MQKRILLIYIEFMLSKFFQQLENWKMINITLFKAETDALLNK